MDIWSSKKKKKKKPFGLDVFLSDFVVLTKLGFPFSMVWLNGVQMCVSGLLCFWLFTWFLIFWFLAYSCFGKFFFFFFPCFLFWPSRGWVLTVCLRSSF
jgi:hypothetical protein